MYIHINEPIQVTAKFAQKGPAPQKFTWKNRHYPIKEINFIHKSKEGNDILTHFAVSTETEAFKITINHTRLTWTLDEIYTRGFIKDNQLSDRKVVYKAKTKKGNISH